MKMNGNNNKALHQQYQNDTPKSTDCDNGIIHNSSSNNNNTTSTGSNTVSIHQQQQQCKNVSSKYKFKLKNKNNKDESYIIRHKNIQNKSIMVTKKKQQQQPLKYKQKDHDYCTRTYKQQVRQEKLQVLVQQQKQRNQNHGLTRNNVNKNNNSTKNKYCIHPSSSSNINYNVIQILLSNYCTVYNLEQFLQKYVPCLPKSILLQIQQQQSNCTTTCTTVSNINNDVGVGVGVGVAVETTPSTSTTNTTSKNKTNQEQHKKQQQQQQISTQIIPPIIIAVNDNNKNVFEQQQQQQQQQQYISLQPITTMTLPIKCYQSLTSLIDDCIWELIQKRQSYKTARKHNNSTMMNITRTTVKQSTTTRQSNVTANTLQVSQRPNTIVADQGDEINIPICENEYDYDNNNDTQCSIDTKNRKNKRKRQEQQLQLQQRTHQHKRNDIYNNDGDNVLCRGYTIRSSTSTSTSTSVAVLVPSFSSSFNGIYPSRTANAISATTTKATTTYNNYEYNSHNILTQIQINSSVDFCKSSNVFKYLHQLLGDDIIRYMILNCSIFIPLPSIANQQQQQQQQQQKPKRILKKCRQRPRNDMNANNVVSTQSNCHTSINTKNGNHNHCNYIQIAGTSLTKLLQQTTTKTSRSTFKPVIAKSNKRNVNINANDISNTVMRDDSSITEHEHDQKRQRRCSHKDTDKTTDTMINNVDTMTTCTNHHRIENNTEHDFNYQSLSEEQCNPFSYSSKETQFKNEVSTTTTLQTNKSKKKRSRTRKESCINNNYINVPEMLLPTSTIRRKRLFYNSSYIGKKIHNGQNVFPPNHILSIVLVQSQSKLNNNNIVVDEKEVSNETGTQQPLHHDEMESDDVLYNNHTTSIIDDDEDDDDDIDYSDIPSSVFDINQPVQDGTLLSSRSHASEPQTRQTTICNTTTATSVAAATSTNDSKDKTKQNTTPNCQLLSSSPAKQLFQDMTAEYYDGIRLVQGLKPSYSINDVDHCSIEAVRICNGIIQRHRSCNYILKLEKSCSMSIMAKTRSSSTTAKELSLETVSQWFTPTESVVAFIQSCISDVFPNEFWGMVSQKSKSNVTRRQDDGPDTDNVIESTTSTTNKDIFINSVVPLFVHLTRHEQLANKTLIHQMKVTLMSWVIPSIDRQELTCATNNDVQKVPSNSTRLSRNKHEKVKLLVISVYRWMIKQYVIELSRAFFYVTESEFSGRRLLYYRKPVWSIFRNLSMKKLVYTLQEQQRQSLKKKQDKNVVVQETTTTAKHFIEWTEVHAMEQLARQRMGLSKLRLVPKATGVRPIATLCKAEKIFSSKAGKVSTTKQYNNRHNEDEQQVIDLTDQQLTSQGLVRKLSILPKPQPNLHQVTNKIPTNAVLQDVFEVLKYEYTQNEELLGFGLIGLDLLHTRYSRFLERIQYKNSSSSLYFASVDIQHCYDNINQEHLLKVIDKILVHDEYVIHKCNMLHPVGDVKSFTRRQLCTVHPTELCRPSFQSIYDLSEKYHHCVFVEGKTCIIMRKHDIMSTLREHITSNLLVTEGRFGKRYLLQSRGIPQGSILSSLLCNFYYGSIEREMLGRGSKCNHQTSNYRINNEVETIVRMIDDFLLMTTKRENVEKFIAKMEAGVPELGVEVNKDKTQRSEDTNHSENMNGAAHAKEEKEWFPWCGMRFHIQTGQVTIDYARFADGKAIDGITIERGRNEGTHLLLQMKSFIQPRCIPLLYDSSINTLETQVLNFYEMFVLGAIKTVKYLEGLSKGRFEDEIDISNSGYLLQCVETTISYGFDLINRKLEKTYCASDRPISEERLSKQTAVSLGWCAFRDVFNKHRSLSCWIKSNHKYIFLKTVCLEETAFAEMVANRFLILYKLLKYQCLA